MLTNIYKKIVDSIDDLNIIRKAYRILYYIMGVITGLLPLVVIGVISTLVGDSPIEVFFDKILSNLSNFWSKFVFSILVLVWLAVVAFLCVMCFKYWKKHGNDIVNVKNRYPNITFVADFIQTYNNSSIFVLLGATVSFAVLAYIFGALTGASHFYRDANFIIELFAVVSLIIHAVVIALIQIMIVSYITESIKRKIQMACDLQDIADVVRVSEITNKTEAI